MIMLQMKAKIGNLNLVFFHVKEEVVSKAKIEKVYFQPILVERPLALFLRDVMISRLNSKKNNEQDLSLKSK